MSEAQHTVTVLEALSASLTQAAYYNRSVAVSPAAVLWPDDSCQWEPLVPLLRELHPAFLTLGEYDQEKRTGPAIWIRCLLAGELEAADWPEGTIPIVYMPGVSRQMLRAVETCPRELQPLAELQYRGVLWSQVSARDWTILAFLKSKDGLGLDVAQDHATLEALSRALLMLADTPIASLRGRRLEAADFNNLLSPDPARDLLRWLSDPGETRHQWTSEHWEAFRSICRESYKFDPQADGELVAVEHMAEQQGPWKAVWMRFVEAPRRYPGIPKLLEQTYPQSLPFDPSCWPRSNAEAESKLRNALVELMEIALQDAAEKLRELEKQHGFRRNWVWAELGQASLAKALEHLTILAETTATAPNGATPEAMADAYAETGWQADAAVLHALAAVSRTEDLAAVKSVIQAVYRPWVEQAALRLQELVQQSAFPGYDKSNLGGVQASTGEVIFFADGLRYDVGRLLQAELLQRGLEVALSTHWTGLPSVTPTSKPAVSPVAHLIKGEDSNQDFHPQVISTGKPITAERFRSLLGEIGYQCLASDEVGAVEGKAWAEHGDLDHMGHEQGWKLSWRIAEQVQELAERIELLLDTGWKRIRVVTDHGWLLVPGGLPKTDLPKYLVDTRWGRCAVLKSTANTDALIVDWRWSNTVRIALAPGISCFRAGIEYTHGGLSLQECLTPNLVVQKGASTLSAAIEDIAWRGLRCRVQTSGSDAGLHVDLRLKPAAPHTSIADGGKSVDANGHASLVVPDDDHIGSAAFVVVVSTDGTVLAKQMTSVGGGD